MRNWKLIEDGDEFEALVGSLLQAEVPGVIVFRRQGPDSGLDAIVSDNTQAYQAKFHASGLMSSAIASAKIEFKKIKEYRDPTHTNYKYWKDVTDWTLIGNFTINSSDKSNWLSKVVPLFNSIGIAAHYKGEEQLDYWLDRNPEIEQSFFSGCIRTLIYPAEAYISLSRRSTNGMFFATEIIGRDASLASVLEFAKSPDHRILSVVGAYCSGKTRFLYEAMAAMAGIGWRVFWGLPESMSKSTTWFRSLGSCKKTCIFIDDPKDCSLVCGMAEQLSTQERSKWKLVFTCSHELVRTLPPDLTSDAQFRTMELPLLTRKDIENIVASCPNIKLPPAAVAVVADVARGMPSLACLFLEFYRKYGHLVLPSDSLTLMDQYVSRNLQTLDRDLLPKAKIVLRWASIWDGMSIGREDKNNKQLCFLKQQGVAFDETKSILEKLASTGIVDKWKAFGNDCYRVQPALVARHIIGTWILEKDGDLYRVGPDGGRLIDLLLKQGVPHADDIFETIPVALGAYLSSPDEAERLFRPVFDHLQKSAEGATIEDQSDVIGMLEKIGRFSPESMFLLLRSIVANPRPDSRRTDHWSIVRAIARTLAGGAEYVRNRPLAMQFVQLFKDIYEATPPERELPNSKRDEIAKYVSSVINHFGELRFFPDIALSMVVERLKNCDMAAHPFEQMLALQMLEPERHGIESASHRSFVLSRRAVRFGSQEWERAITVRTELMNALRRCDRSEERETLWILFRAGYQFVHNLSCGLPNCEHQPTSTAALKLVEADLQFLTETLGNVHGSLSLHEMQLMRKVWEWEYLYGNESAHKAIAAECERLFIEKVGFPFQYLSYRHPKEYSRYVNEASAKILQAKSADEIDSFFHEAEVFFRTEGLGCIDGVCVDSFGEIAELCSTNYDFTSKDPIGDFTMQCLHRFDNDHPLSAVFAATQIKHYFRNQKTNLGLDTFESVFSQVVSEAKDQDFFLRHIYASGDSSVFGPFTSIEFDHLISSKMSPLDMARVLPPWIEMDHQRVLNRLSSALEEARVVNQNCDMVLEMVVTSFFWAMDRRNGLDERSVPLDWIVEKVNEGYAGSHLLTSYSFVELAKRKRIKLDMAAMRRFVEARIRLERSRGYDFLRSDEFQPQLVFAISDIEGFNRICDLMFVDDSSFVRTELSSIIASIDQDGKNTCHFIMQYLDRHPCNSRDELACLARLVAPHQISAMVQDVLNLICDRCAMMSSNDREYIYDSMLPDEWHSASWGGGEVPKKYLDALNNAQELNDKTLDDSSAKEYYEYRMKRAACTVKMIRDGIEDEKHI